MHRHGLYKGDLQIKKKNKFRNISHGGEGGQEQEADTGWVWWEGYNSHHIFENSSIDLRLVQM